MISERKAGLAAPERTQVVTGSAWRKARKDQRFVGANLTAACLLLARQRQPSPAIDLLPTMLTRKADDW